MSSTAYSIRRLVRQIRPQVSDDLASLVQRLAAHRVTRKGLNVYYSMLSSSGQEEFYSRFAKVFRQHELRFQDGSWSLRLEGRRLSVPLRDQFEWLDWDAALSITGHEAELKQTYRTLAKLEHPPRLAFDVGTNYGTHSLFLLTCGIPTISFEPNPVCHDFFRLACERNRLKYKLESLAVGASAGSIELWYPECEEWLGTTHLPAKEQLGGRILKHEVQMTTIDDYVSEHSAKPDLIKIDVEGADLAVMRGAAATLASARPIVLFECWKSPSREQFVEFLNASEYAICGLPLEGASRPHPLSRDEFEADDHTNFGALPVEMFDTWPPKFGVSHE